MNVEKIKEAVRFVKEKLPSAKPECVMMLGSGWGSITSIFEQREALNFADIPGMGRTGVAGHSGELLWCGFGKTELLVFKGRRHWYEGAGWEPVVLPAFIAREMGADVFVITNACGGIRRDLYPGTLMVITDHINAMNSNPLIGMHGEFSGPRFPDQTNLYNSKLRNIMLKAAQNKGKKLSTGVYLAVSGPTYETPAEVKMFSEMGADAVGMSTVPEAITANAIGLKVLGISCVTNMAAGIAKTRLSHEEVQATMEKASTEIKVLIADFLEELKEKKK